MRNGSKLPERLMGRGIRLNTPIARGIVLLGSLRHD